MRELLFIVVVAIAAGIGFAAEQLGLPVPLKGRKYRAVSTLAVLPIALLCALAVIYAYTALPIWSGLLLVLPVLTLGGALALFLVGRLLPNKIKSREDEDY